jgi:hypothetical protein
MSTTTITLKHPIKAHGETVETIELKRPTVKHLRAMDKAAGDVDRVASLISELAVLPPSSVDQIDAEDFGAISDVIAVFFGNSPLAGPAS